MELCIARCVDRNCFVCWTTLRNYYKHMEFYSFMIVARLRGARLVRGPSTAKDAAKYVESAKRRITYNAAAAAWAQGVPWSEALDIATRAISKASPKAKPLPKRKAKAKASQWGR